MNAVSRLVPVALCLALVAPMVAAGPSLLLVRSVGEIFVDASGHASGLNLAADISEVDGIVRSFHAVALDREVFASVAVDGFRQSAKIQGVGSPIVSLQGSNARIVLHDNINSVLAVETSEAATVRYELASGIEAVALDGSRAIADLHAEEGYVGSVVIVGGDGPGARGERIHVIQDAVHARTRAGVQVVFVARPVYVEGDAYPRALVEALAEGHLAASYVTELDGSSVAASLVDYGRADVEVVSDSGTVRSTVESTGGAVLVSFDLAYETLPARTAEDVSLYVDGQLAQRAQSAAEVVANLRSGLPSYHTYVSEGRAQVLASTPDFRVLGEHTLSLAAAGRAATEAQARAEAVADGDARVVGDFSYKTGGKLLGSFVTAFIPEGSSDLHSFTTIASRAEVFRSVTVAGNGAGAFQAGGHRLTIDGAKAAVTLVDDAYATLLVEAKDASDVTLDLAEGLRASARGEGVVRIDGPQGPLGHVIAPGLRVGPEGRLEADLPAGARLVFRGTPETFASEDVVVKAIAEGRVGAQLLAGQKGGQALATSQVELVDDVAAKARAQAEGLVVEYASASSAAKSFVLDARGSALSAKSASDVRVLLDGAPVAQAASAADALAVGGKARYFAETSADGGLRLLVNAAKPAGASSFVTIESRLDEAARAAAGTDSFGTFKVFEDGTAVGSFVRFRSDQAAGAIGDYGLRADGRGVFASLVAGDSPFSSSGLDGATTLVLENREARLEVSDTTSGLLKVLAKQRTEASFRLGDGLDALPRSDRVLEVRDAAGAHVGSLVATGGTLTADAGDVRAALQQGGQVMWRSHVGLEQELSDAQRSMVNEAIAAGRIAGQVVARAGAAGALEASSSAVVDAVTTQYSSDVHMMTAAARDRVEVTLSSESPVGKTVLITLDRATVPGLAEGDALVLFDGLPAAEADSFADVLDATDDGGVAEYLVLAGDAGSQVLVSIPHWSVHTVTIQERPAERSSHLLVYATIVLGALALAEGAALVLRRRKA